MNDFIWQKVDAAFAKYDTNKDGRLSMDEAREFIEQRCKFEFGKEPSEEEIAQTFKKIDTNKDNYISREELYNALTTMYFPARLFH